MKICNYGGTGRRTGLKILRGLNPRVGSTPTNCTTKKKQVLLLFLFLYFFIYLLYIIYISLLFYFNYIFLESSFPLLSFASYISALFSVSPNISFIKSSLNSINISSSISVLIYVGNTFYHLSIYSYIMSKYPLKLATCAGDLLIPSVWYPFPFIYLAISS